MYMSPWTGWIKNLRIACASVQQKKWSLFVNWKLNVNKMLNVREWRMEVSPEKNWHEQFDFVNKNETKQISYDLDHDDINLNFGWWQQCGLVFLHANEHYPIVYQKYIHDSWLALYFYSFLISNAKEFNFILVDKFRKFSYGRKFHF